GVFGVLGVNLFLPPGVLGVFGVLGVNLFLPPGVLGVFGVLGVNLFLPPGVFGVFGVLGVLTVPPPPGVLGVFGVFGVLAPPPPPGVFGVFGVFGVLTPPPPPGVFGVFGVFGVLAPPPPPAVFGVFGVLGVLAPPPPPAVFGVFGVLGVLAPPPPPGVLGVLGVFGVGGVGTATALWVVDTASALATPTDAESSAAAQEAPAIRAILFRAMNMGDLALGFQPGEPSHWAAGISPRNGVPEYSLGEYSTLRGSKGVTSSRRSWRGCRIWSWGRWLRLADGVHDHTLGQRIVRAGRGIVRASRAAVVASSAMARKPPGCMQCSRAPTIT
ncbi:hypothetical protein ABZS88_23565, partial [Streptomyces sp. NPDC005480]